MSRQAQDHTAPADMPEILPAVVTRIENAQTALTVEARQHDSAVRAMAHSMGYQLPADCTDPDLIQRDISANMRRSVEACLQVGMGLAVLKTACAHGEFTARLEVLGIDKYVASRFISSAAKFSKLPSTATLKALGSQTKLFEMLCLGDDQLEELELTGQTGDLTLDDVASMSVKELRKAVREERAEHKATKERLKNRAQQIEDLEQSQARLKRAKPNEILKALKAEASACATEARAIVFGPLSQAVNQLVSVHDNALFAAALLGEVQRELTLLRDAHGLPDVSSAQELQQAADVAAWGNDNTAA